MMNENLKSKERRAFIKGVGAAGVALAAEQLFGATEALAKSDRHLPEKYVDVFNALREKYNSIPSLTSNINNGTYIDIRTLKLDSYIPVPNHPERMIQTFDGKNVTIVIKHLNAFITFYKDESGGVAKSRVGFLGTARTDKGYVTPEGIFTVHRKEGAHYRAQAVETRGADMGFAVFFHNGIAFHRSGNVRVFGGDEYIKKDNSHGCGNTNENNAEFLHSKMDIGDTVIVLP